MFIAIVNALNVSADELLCDSLKKSKYIYQNEMADITQDCSENEMRVMIEMVKSIKSSLRKTYERSKSI
jgi:hypothetical protein